MLKPLRVALRTWSPASGGGDALGAAAAAWPEVVGTQIARHSRPVQIAGDTLVVATRSSAWSEQMSFLSERILTALRDRCGLKNLTKMRFRAGATSLAPMRAIRGSVAPPRNEARRRWQSQSLEESIARFRSDVRRARRANAALGSKECEGCASLVVPDRTLCAACVNRIAQERERLVSRLLFDVPWLGFAGIAALVDGLGKDEYEAIRTRLLSRWWAILERARDAKRLSRDGRERLVASSYAIVKTGLEPERIAPETMRDLLGDELTELLKRRGSE